MSVDRFKWMNGSITTPNGVIAVSYENKNGTVTFKVKIPQGTKAKFSFEDKKVELREGENKFEVEL